MSKLKDSDVLAMYDMFREGKSNLEVAAVFGVHDRYVSLIRHGKRFGHLYSKRQETFANSMASAGLSYEQFVEVINSEESNLEIGKRLNISPSSISRLISPFGKYMRRNSEGATTIERIATVERTLVKTE